MWWLWVGLNKRVFWLIVTQKRNDDDKAKRQRQKSSTPQKRSHCDEYLTLPIWGRAIGIEGCAFGYLHRYFSTAMASISNKTPSVYSRVTGINVLAGG